MPVLTAVVAHNPGPVAIETRASDGIPTTPSFASIAISRGPRLCASRSAATRSANSRSCSGAVISLRTRRISRIAAW